LFFFHCTHGLLQIPGQVQCHRTPTSYCIDLSKRDFVLPVPNWKREKPNRSNGKISYRFYESNTANHTTLDDRKTKICDSTRWAEASNAEVIITELSYIFSSMFQR